MQLGVSSNAFLTSRQIKTHSYMKNILVIGMAVLLFSCGSGGKGDGKDSTGSDVKHSERFDLLNISSDGLPFGTKLGMKIDEVKKNHKEAPDEDSDNEVLQYTKKIGPDD